MMFDMYMVVRDFKQVMDEFKKQYKFSMEVFKGVGLILEDYEVVIRFMCDFWEQNRDFIVELVKIIGKFVFIEMWDQRFFYFIFKFEFNFVDNFDKVVVLSIVQIDVENVECFGIKYYDEEGKERILFIFYCLFSGVIERVMYVIFEKQVKFQEKGIKLMYLFWFSLIQVCVILVSDEVMDYVFYVVGKFEGVKIRVDVDDMGDRFNKKIRKVEKEWILYIIVVGRNEKEQNIVIVRRRSDGRQVEMQFEDLIREIKGQIEGFLYKLRFLLLFFSRRLKFRG